MALTPYCLDTSAYSHLRRGDPTIVGLIDSARWIGLPAVVIGELLAGFKFGSRERENTDELWEFLADPATDIVPVDESVARHYADIHRQLRADGRPIPTNDIWIAATAMSDGSTVLTTDRHFTLVAGLATVIV